MYPQPNEDSTCEQGPHTGRILAVPEGPEEILARSYRRGARVAKSAYRRDPGICARTVHLRAVLIGGPLRRASQNVRGDSVLVLDRHLEAHAVLAVDGIVVCPYDPESEA